MKMLKKNQLFGLFAEFNQGAAGAFRMEERDVKTFGTFAGSLVNQFATFFFEFAERIGNAVGDVEGYVLDASCNVYTSPSPPDA